MTAPMTLRDLPPTAYDLQRQRDRVVLAEDAERERLRLRADNHDRGHEEPKPGDRFYVQLDGSILRRRRSGVEFVRNTRIGLVVVEGPEDEVRKMQMANKTIDGLGVVGVLGMEYIFEDHALHVFEVPLDEANVKALRDSHELLEKRLAEANAELEALRTEKRNARMNAVDNGDGRPSRLPAQRSVKPAQAPQASAPTPAVSPTTAQPDHAEHNEFGAEPEHK